MNFKISNIGLKYGTHKIVINIIFVIFTGVEERISSLWKDLFDFFFMKELIYQADFVPLTFFLLCKDD